MVTPSEIIRSLDEAVRVDLENARDWYFVLLQSSTVVVALGCILEIPEVVHEVWGMIPKRLVRPVKITAAIGLLLVIGGIAGEWCFEARVATAEGLVQGFDEILLADTQRETALAQLETAQLQDDTEALKTEGDTERAVAAGALQKAGEASLVAGAASKHANELDLQTEQLRAENDATETKLLAANQALEVEKETRLELEKSLEPRVLYLKEYTDKTQNNDGLKALAGTPVAVEYIPDFESERAARLVAKVLELSGWKILTVRETKAELPDGVSVAYLIHSMSEANLGGPTGWQNWSAISRQEALDKRACETVIEFLKEEGWEADLSIASGIRTGSVIVKVGFKPNSYFMPEGFKAMKRQYENTMKRVSPIPAPTSKSVEGEWSVSPWTVPPSKP